MPSLFFDESEIPILRQSFCVFLDALGFVELVKEVTENGSADELLVQFFNIHKESSDYWKNMTPLWEHKCFTDNVVFACPLDNENVDSEGLFGTVFSSAGMHQLDMMMAGFFLRGAMTLGPLHLSENFVFGKAVIDAAELEKAANFPRIGISAGVMEEVYNHFESYDYIQSSPHNETILIDDGVFFLNYLDPLIDGNSAEDIEFHGFYRHRELVLANLEKFQNKNKVRTKYEWSARFHNHIVDRQAGPLLIEYGDNPEVLKIPGFESQPCLSLSEYIKTQPPLFERFAEQLL